MDAFNVRSSSKFITNIANQGPWNEQSDQLPTPRALPMPVEVSDPASLAPFFAFLHGNDSNGDAANGVRGTEPGFDTEMIEFEKGVLYEDGRVDLCKMVTGPRNIGDLMTALRSNSFAKHFLLGNNIIGPEGAREIAQFITERPQQFETWYLAGNCIDAPSFNTLVHAMVQSPIITNVWLKRNPLDGACNDLFRLITESHSLRTLDLDQTELGDSCVASLFNSLTTHDKPIALRNVYLNANGVGIKACDAIGHYLASSNCRLESLYLSNNPIGDGVTVLANNGLRKTTTLKRFMLQSCGLKDEGCKAVLAAATDHPSLQVLDVGQSYATQDLGSRFNWITDASVHALAKLIEGQMLQYFNIHYQPISQAALNTVLEAAVSSNSLLWFNAKPLVKGGKSYQEVKAGQVYVRMHKALHATLVSNVSTQYSGLSYTDFENGPKRYLLSPPDIRLIDSVYRTRDFDLARRGIKPLVKSWDEDDDTLEKVASGEVF